MMIVRNSDEEEENVTCIPPFHFIPPQCTLPDFLDSPSKWTCYVYETNTLQLWCELMTKIESYSPLVISDEELKTIIQGMAEDLIYTHGMINFFPTGHCSDCGIVHSVSYFAIFLLLM